MSSTRRCHPSERKFQPQFNPRITWTTDCTTSTTTCNHPAFMQKTTDNFPAQRHALGHPPWCHQGQPADMGFRVPVSRVQLSTRRRNTPTLATEAPAALFRCIQVRRNQRTHSPAMDSSFLLPKLSPCSQPKSTFRNRSTRHRNTTSSRTHAPYASKSFIPLRQSELECVEACVPCPGDNEATGACVAPAFLAGAAPTALHSPTRSPCMHPASNPCGTRRNQAAQRVECCCSPLERCSSQPRLSVTSVC